MTDLMWCGADPGSNFRCPKELNGWGDFQQTNGGFNGARNAWWQGASREYAKTAYGETHIFIYRSNANIGAFYGNSILSKVEIPHMDSEKITNVKILLAKELGFTGTESCESESILGLKWELRKRNFGKDQIECIDNPWQIEAMLCFDNPEDAVCKRYQSLDVLEKKLEDTEKKLDDAEEKSSIFKNWTISGWFLFSLSLISMFLIYRSKKKRESTDAVNHIETAAATAQGRSLGAGELDDHDEVQESEATRMTRTTYFMEASMLKSEIRASESGIIDLKGRKMEAMKELRRMRREEYPNQEIEEQKDWADQIEAQILAKDNAVKDLEKQLQYLRAHKNNEIGEVNEEPQIETTEN